MGMQKNVLVVGGGLAGSFIAMETAKRGHHVSLVDQPNPKSASRVAAGMYNVLTGREAKKTWMAEEMLAALQGFLAHPDFASLAQYVHPMPIYRPYPDGRTGDYWKERVGAPELEGIARHVGEPRQPALIHNPHGGIDILPCGWVETGHLCAGMLEVLTSRYAFTPVQATFDPACLDPATGACGQAGMEGTYDEVIFAEGMGIRQNPWFHWVEIRPLKGQIVELRMAPGLDEHSILLRKVFLIPKGHHVYTVGSTYEPQYAQEEPTAEGIKILTDSVEAATRLAYEVVSARAAVRPTTPNRRPVLGRHPEHERLVVMNGLGTKGVLQAPYCAALLRDWLDGEIDALPKEVQVSRFLKNFA